MGQINLELEGWLGCGLTCGRIVQGVGRVRSIRLLQARRMWYILGWIRQAAGFLRTVVGGGKMGWVGWVMGSEAGGL